MHINRELTYGMLAMDMWLVVLREFRRGANIDNFVKFAER